MEHTALDVALDTVVTHAAATGRTPLLGDVAAALNNPAALGNPAALYEAAGMMSGRLGDAARDLRRWAKRDAPRTRRLVRAPVRGQVKRGNACRAYGGSRARSSVTLTGGQR